MNLNKDLQNISKKDLTEAIMYIKGEIKGRVPQNGYEDICNAIQNNVNSICSDITLTPLESKNIGFINKTIQDVVVYYNTLNTTKILNILIDNIEIETSPIPMF